MKLVEDVDLLLASGGHGVIIEARIVVLEEQACGEWQCVGMGMEAVDGGGF